MSVTAAPRPRIVCVSTYGGHAGGAAVAMQRLTTALAAAGPRRPPVAGSGAAFATAARRFPTPCFPPTGRPGTSQRIPPSSRPT